MHVPVESLLVSDMKNTALNQLHTNSNISLLQWIGLTHHNDPSEESPSLLASTFT